MSIQDAFSHLPAVALVSSENARSFCLGDPSEGHDFRPLVDRGGSNGEGRLQAGQHVRVYSGDGGGCVSGQATSDKDSGFLGIASLVSDFSKGMVVKRVVSAVTSEAQVVSRSGMVESPAVGV